MAMIVLNLAQLLAALCEEFVVVQVAAVAGNAVVTTRVNSLGHFLTGYQRLIEFLTVTCTDNFHFSLAILRINLSISLLQSFSKHIKCRSGSFLHKQVTILTMSESIDNKVHCIIQCHHEAGHVRVGDGNGFALLHLLNPKWNHRTARSHHIPIACTADSGLCVLTQGSALSNGHLFHHSL